MQKAYPIKDCYPKIPKKVLKLKSKKTKNSIKKKWAKDLNSHLTKEDMQTANKHVKRCYTSYLIREMQIKILMRYHCPPIRLAKIQSTDNTISGKDVDNRHSQSLLAGIQNGTATLEDGLVASQKTKNTLTTYNLAVMLLGI